MRLTDLNPHWLTVFGAPPDAKLGVRFDCPTQPPESHPQNPTWRMAIFFANPICGNAPVDIEFFKQVQMDCDHPNWEPWMADHHVGKMLWTRTGDSFENLSLSPSVDGSAWGGWHGHITNGEVQ